MYEQTLATYRSVFGQKPPADIWPPAAKRFGQDLRHQVVNTAQNWVIPKAPIKRVVGGTTAALATALFVPGCVGGDFNPFNLIGAEFLGFLIPMMIAAVCVGRFIRFQMRGPDAEPGDDTVTLTWEQIAYLSGDFSRLASAAIVRLIESGAAVLSEDKKQVLPGYTQTLDNLSPVERAVLKELPVTRSVEDMRRLRSAVEFEFSSQAVQLENEGFALTRRRQFQVWLGSVLPIVLVVFLLAVPRLVMGVVNQKPIAYLVATMVLGGLVGFVFAQIGNSRVSRRGENLLVWLRSRHAGLKKGSGLEAPGSTALAVALFGTMILDVAGMNALKTWFPGRGYESAHSCGSGCGTSGGDGGGGCGGGGCGGCGGGD